MQRALVGGTLAVVATSVVGTWVVIRGMTFLGDALAHGVIPGIAVALVVGFPPALGALGAALVMSGAVSGLSRVREVREETAIGLLFVGMLSLGVVIVSRSDAFATDLSTLLFGDILAVSRHDLGLQAAAAAAVVAVAALLHRAFLALSFNSTTARSLGLRPELAHAAMLALVALSIVASFQVIGTLLVFGLLVGPPATASLLVRRLPMRMLTSAVLGVVEVVIGLLLSFHHGTAAGATIAGLSVGGFFAALLARSVRGRLRA